MASLTELGSWISQNESLLSGLAAMIVLGGVVVSGLGMALRRIGRARDVPEAGERPTDSNAPSAAAAAPGRVTLEMLTAPSPHETKFANSGGIHIAYNERGEGPYELLVAPGIISHLNMLDNLPPLRGTFDRFESIARVVTFDKRGQGLSDPTLSPPTTEERTDDIAAVMDAAGMGRAVLLGFSEGGPMCLHFAYTHPERVQGLVLVGSTARFTQSEDFPIGLSKEVLQGVAGQWGRGGLRRVFFPSISHEQLDDDTYKAFERLIGTPAAMQQIVEMMIETDVRALLPEIHIPTLVIHFSGDLAVPIRLGRYLAENLPNAEFMEVKGVDHGDLSQSPEAIERIRQFCERVSAAPAG